MMKISKKIGNILNIRILIIGLISILVFSCKSGDTLADKGIIQKRKYQKGYYVNIKTPFDSKNNSVDIEKTTDDSFTASLRATLPSNSIEPVLAKPIAKESKLKVEATVVNRQIQTNADQILETEDVAEASLGSTNLLDAKTNFYSSKNQFQNQPQDYYSARRLSTVSLLSFIFGILSLFVLGIPFGIAAVVLGIIGIVQVEKNRDIYKGQGFAIAGLIIGLIAVIVVAAYLASAA